MGCCCKILTLAIVAIGVGIGWLYLGGLQKTTPPIIPLQKWWGPGYPSKSMDASIRPFAIEFEPEMVTDLKNRLKAADFYTEPLEGIQFEYGFNTKYLKEIVEFWNNKYDFSAREKYLNTYPQFKTNIQGLDIHYLHVKPKATKNLKVLPLLLLHGWPGSVLEFYKMIPLLTTPRPGSDFVFEVIVPSLPGYGYSQAASKPGFGPAAIGGIMKNLMERLGHQKYYIQGGDWGSVIGAIMSIVYPENIAGYHTNAPSVSTTKSYLKLLIGSLYPSYFVEDGFESKMYPLSKVFGFIMLESGYMHLQATKPDTAGIALRDSPVGLAAYILEKFSTWTNRDWRNLPDGGLTKKYTLMELLDNIMIYWDSKSITTSMRLYTEAFNKDSSVFSYEGFTITVPTAIARFENELLFQSKWLLQEKYANIVQLTDYKGAGHFPALEDSQRLADDFWNAVPKFIEHHNKQKSKKEL